MEPDSTGVLIYTQKNHNKQEEVNMYIETRVSTSLHFKIKNGEGEIIARASMFCISNEDHEQHYGLLEDVFVNEDCRGKGLAKELVQEIIKKAKELCLYKIIATSRHERTHVHQLYEKLGFENHGTSFRMNL